MATRKQSLVTMPARNPVTDLRVHLRVWVEVSVPVRALNPAVCAIREPIRPDVGIVMAEAHARRDSLEIIGHIDVEAAQQVAPRMPEFVVDGSGSLGGPRPPT